MAQGSLHLALCLALGDGLATVVLAATASQGQLDLGPPALKVETQRHKRQALFLHLSRQLTDLLSVEEKLAAASRLVVEAAGSGVGPYVGTHQPHLASLRPGVGIPQIHPPIADGLDLGAGKGNPGLQPLQDVVVVLGLAVDSDRLLGHC